MTELYMPLEPEDDKAEEAIGTFLGDALFVCPTAAFARSLRRHSVQFYFYRFMHKLRGDGFLGQVMKSYNKLGSDADSNAEAILGMLLASIGVPHTYDLYFLFNAGSNPYSDVVEFLLEETRVARYM